MYAGVNMDEIEAMLQAGYDAKAPTYKPDLKAQTSKSESPWGVKREINLPSPSAPKNNQYTDKHHTASFMGNGKDFWLELRKQVYALQQSGGTSQGG